MKKTLSGVLFLISVPLLAQSIFLPENGDYLVSNSIMLDQMERQGMYWVSAVPEKTILGAQYKILPNQNEFRIKDWFKRDWFLMQDMFKLSPETFISHYRARTFNEAKWKQYSGFNFDFKNYFYLKNITTPSEWGGLTHPPIKKLSMPLEKYDANYTPIDYSKVESIYFNPAFEREVDQASLSELTFGNTVHALADHHSFLIKKRMIQNARSSIFMSSLAFACDKSSKEIIDLLIRKHQEGVDVRVITDGTISTLMGYRECPRLLRAAGVEVIMTSDFLSYNKKSIYHTKTLITDFTEAVAGGQNMLDADNLSRTTDFMNRDLDLYAKGPLATDIARQFLENWTYHFTFQKAPKGLSEVLSYAPQLKQIVARERASGQRGVDLYASVLGHKSKRMKGVCRFIKQAPYRDGHTITKAYLKMLDGVKHYLMITDPVKSDTYTNDADRGMFKKLDPFTYFNLLHQKVQTLIKSGKRLDYLTTSVHMTGNETVAIMNEQIKNDLNSGHELKADWHLTLLEFSNTFYSNSHYKNLLKDYVPYKNVNVWTNIAFMHTKVFYFDRVAASLGSLNFQHNATDQAYESTAICMDETLNHELDRILVQDMANSIPLIHAK
jgi:phosphatidylserine/phosphatidylglycerophosphate/cardiolipin synthase-like enzyme